MIRIQSETTKRNNSVLLIYSSLIKPDPSEREIQEEEEEKAQNESELNQQRIRRPERNLERGSNAVLMTDECHQDRSQRIQWGHADIGSRNNYSCKKLL